MTKLLKIKIAGLSIIALLIANLIFAQEKSTADFPVLTVDVSKHLGTFKPINGINGGPRITIGAEDNSEFFKAINLPMFRLHDIPYVADETVDIHHIFPDFDANENDPKNYKFAKTDLYIKSVLDCGSKVRFRLGESIEGGDPEKFLRFYVHPPKDYKKWARICCNIIRHYNEGWANGFKWDIKYWEIWNEYNSKGNWTGTSEEYFKLYEVASKTIKKSFPDLKVGGPALNCCIGYEEGRKFLAYCRDHKLPLDFVSWHAYASHPKKVVENIELGIAAIKEFGYPDAETNIDEWNFWGIKWGLKNRKVKYDNFMNVGSELGASFTASVLTYMQNSELDASCYYTAYRKLGIFDYYGIPRKPFYTFIAYNELIKCGTQIEASGNNIETGLAVIAAINEDETTTSVMLSNFDDETSNVVLDMKNLSGKNMVYCSEYLLDKEHSMDFDREQSLSGNNARLVVNLPRHTVRLLLFSSEPGNGKPLYYFEDIN